MTHTRAERQNRRSVDSKLEWKEMDRQTDGRTEAIALPSPRANAVGKC